MLLLWCLLWCAACRARLICSTYSKFEGRVSKDIVLCLLHSYYPMCPTNSVPVARKQRSLNRLPGTSRHFFGSVKCKVSPQIESPTMQAPKEPTAVRCGAVHTVCCVVVLCVLLLPAAPPGALCGRACGLGGFVNTCNRGAGGMICWHEGKSMHTLWRAPPVSLVFDAPHTLAT